MIGNYGIPSIEYWESEKIQIAGLVVCDYIDTPSHHESLETLATWLKRFNIPAIEIKDTRDLTQKLRTHGVILGKIICGLHAQTGENKIDFEDPNIRNLVEEVSTKNIYKKGKGKKTIVLIDCGVKFNIIKQLVKRNLEVVVVPWNTDVVELPFSFSAVVISNGPGDPTKVVETIKNVKKILAKKIPTFGICLGNQILAIAMGGTTYKLPFGHRSQNQPCVLSGTKKCYLTTQNHGFAVKKIPENFKEWFYNANDKTNEGIIHKTLPFMSVQFHPESSPGPLDTDWVFDYFLKKAKINTKK